MFNAALNACLVSGRGLISSCPLHAYTYCYFYCCPINGEKEFMWILL